MHKRLKTELKTVEAMIGLYCSGIHGEKTLCSECSDLLEYARSRLEKCPYGKDKPACARCPVHCYRPPMREKIRAVMRYAGPRMIYRHPLLALRHMLARYIHPAPAALKPRSGQQRL